MSLVTLADLKKARFRPVIDDGAKGMAFQIHRCVEYPRFTMQWFRSGKGSRTRFKQMLYVDGMGVASLEAAVGLLSESKETVAEVKRLVEDADFPAGHRDGT